jgi:molybdopterin converting factor small subunit
VKVEVTLFATLADFLPAGTEGDRAVIEIKDGSTIADLARTLGIPEKFPWIALVNGEESDATRRLVARDAVTLFPPLAGGSAPPPMVRTDAREHARLNRFTLR